MKDRLKEDAYILTVKYKTKKKENSKKIVVYASDFYDACKEAGKILMNLQEQYGEDYKVYSLELDKLVRYGGENKNAE